MKRCINLSIGETTIHKIADNGMDTNFLIGKYSMDRLPGIIVRATGKFVEDYPEDEPVPLTRDHTYPFFNPPENGDEIGSAEYRKHAMRDYQRAESYNRGEWSYIAIQITTEVKSDLWQLNTVVTDSLSAVESDGGDQYLETVIEDLKGEVKRILLGMGFAANEIDRSFCAATVKDR